MGIIEDLRKELDAYEKDNVDTRIVDFAIIGGGTVLNENEIFQFQVRVTNQSHLDMKNVRVRINGSRFADVASILGPFGSRVDSVAFDLDAHQRRDTVFFRGRAKASTEGTEQDIVTAQILSWDASLDHLLRDHSGMGPREGKLHMEIAPD